MLENDTQKIAAPVPRKGASFTYICCCFYKENNFLSFNYDLLCLPMIINRWHYQFQEKVLRLLTYAAVSVKKARL